MLSHHVDAQLLIGPTISGQFSRFSFFDQATKDVYRSLPSPGFNAGVMASMKVKEKFYLSGGFVFAQKSRLIKSHDDILYRNFVNIRYIELPILYTYELAERLHKYTGKGGLVKTYKLFFGAGPTISYWLGGRGKIITSNLKEDQVGTLKYRIIFNKENNALPQDEYGDKMNVADPNRFQFALNFAGGAAFETSRNQKLIVSVNLELAQTFLSRTSIGYFPISFVDQDPLKGKFQSIRLTASYLFDTKIAERMKGKSTNDRRIKRKR